MTQREEKFVHVFEWVAKEYCEIVPQLKFENVQERNPNQIDFLQLDEKKVTLLDNVLRPRFIANDATSMGIVLEDVCI